jgi:uncharacterized protein (TIGR03437 family)
MPTVFNRKSSLALAALFALLPGGAMAQQYIASTIAGTPASAGLSGDGGPATSAQFSGPIAIAVDRQGNYYVADYLNFLIRRISAKGVITSFAGNGTSGYSGDGGPASAAQLSTVHGLAVDAAGNLYISDTANAVIRKVDLNGNITTFAGTGVRGYTGNFGPAINAEFTSPAGLAFDPAGNLYVADVGAGSVRSISPNGTIFPFAGTGFAGFGSIVGEGGYGFRAVLSLPYAVAADTAGNVYIGDVGASAIAKVGTDSVLHTVVSQVAIGSLGADSFGNVFFADYHNNTISRINPDGTVNNIAGDTVPSYNGDGGPSQFAEFNQPYGVAADPSGNLYIAEYANQDVRLLTPIATGALFVTNGASNISASGNLVVAPGEVVTLFGYALGDPAIAQPDSNGNFGTTLGNTTVTVNGVAAPILATYPGHVSIVVPSSTAGNQANFVVSYAGAVAGTGSSQIFPALPGIFTPASTGINSLAVLNADGSVNASGNAAAESSAITFFMTGAGAYSPSLPDGQIASAATNVTTALPVTVLINGENAVVSSVQTVPGQPGSVLQVVATIPSDVTTASNVPLQVRVSNLGSQATTIAVQ